MKHFLKQHAKYMECFKKLRTTPECRRLDLRSLYLFEGSHDEMPTMAALNDSHFLTSFSARQSCKQTKSLISAILNTNCRALALRSGQRNSLHISRGKGNDKHVIVLNYRNRVGMSITVSRKILKVSS